MELTVERGRLRVKGWVIPLGGDLVVVITGGRAHIGAVGMAEPRPSLRDPSQRSASSSVYTFLGHKEDEVAKAAAEELARRLGRKVVVVAGLHWDDIVPEEIGEVLELCRDLTAQIAARVPSLDRSL